MGDGLNDLLGITNRSASGGDSVVGASHERSDGDESEANLSEGLGSLRSVGIDEIEPNEFQPRVRFVEDELAALSDSIREVGVLQPLLLRRIDEGRYELIAGERRWRAARLAGLEVVPAIVRSADDRTSLEQAVVENLHRADLNPLEEAAAYRQLMEEFAMTQDGVARRVGKSRSAVANLLRLFQLPTSVQRLIASEQLSAGHARALLGLAEVAAQESMAERIVRDGLSVRQVEQAVRAAENAGEGRGNSARPPEGSKSAALLEVEREFEETFGTSVEVSMTQGRGRVTIDFADLEDLDRIYRLVTGQ